VLGAILDGVGEGEVFRRLMNVPMSDSETAWVMRWMLGFYAAAERGLFVAIGQVVDDLFEIGVGHRCGARFGLTDDASALVPD
jgi:hypothetical protein